ncbi:hypothetical protein FQA39_LY06242 [Lamprigera yunnana]|nr:hypothetical protein FQA39_LY06242 [Lamprigera yunnana]
MMNSEKFNESSTCERQGYELSVDEIVTMTVRALMTHQQITAAPLNVERENREGRRRTPSPPSFKNHEIASLLPEFSGHDDDKKLFPTKSGAAKKEKKTTKLCEESVSDEENLEGIDDIEENDSSEEESDEWPPPKKIVGEFVAFLYEGNVFAGQIIIITEEAMKREGKL